MLSCLRDRSRWVFICITLLWLSCLRDRSQWVFVCMTLLWLSCLRDRSRGWVFICIAVAVPSAWQKSVSERSLWVFICMTLLWLSCLRDRSRWVTEVDESSDALLLLSCLRDRSRWVFICITLAVPFAWQKMVSVLLHYCGFPVCVTEDGESSFALLWLSCLRDRNRWIFICIHIRPTAGDRSQWVIT